MTLRPVCALLLSFTIGACPDDPSDDDATTSDVPLSEGDAPFSETPGGLTVLAEVSGETTATRALELEVDGVRLVINAGSLAGGTTITMRLLAGVAAKAGPQPWQGRVVELLPEGLAWGAGGASLTFDVGAAPAGARWTGITAAADAAAWTNAGLAWDMGEGQWYVTVPHFSFWAIAAEEVEAPTSVTFAGVSDAQPASDGGGGVMLTVPRATTTATRPWFGFVDTISYLVYVAASEGGQDFQRTHGMLVHWDGEHVAARVLGLVPGTRYCFVVRARDAEGSEDGNTVERCAIAAAMTPPTATLELIRLAQGDVRPPYFDLVSTTTAGGVRLDLERSADGATWVPIDAAYVDETGGAGFRDQPPSPGTWSYRVVAWDAGVALVTSAPLAVVMPAAVFPGPRAPLEASVRPHGVGTPLLHIDAAGRLLLADNPCAQIWTAVDLDNPVIRGIESRPELWSGQDPIVFWHRVACGLAQFPRGVATGHSTSALARAANGDVFVSDGHMALYRLPAGGTGCAELVNTTFDRGVHALAAHPTDAGRIAVVDGLGAHVSIDGGSTFVRWVPTGHASLVQGLQRLPHGAAAWSPDGARLWVGLGSSLATSTDGGASFVEELVPGLMGMYVPKWVAAIAVRADGVAAVMSGGDNQDTSVVVGPAGALVAEPITRTYDGVGRHALLWLDDGRLLALGDGMAPSAAGARRWLHVRAAGGGFSQSLLASPADHGPTILDAADGMTRYAGLLRSRDGGASWDRTPLGRVNGVTLDAAGTGSLVFGTEVNPDYSGVGTERRRSMDQGETWTVLAGEGHDDAGLITFSAEAPERGITSKGGYTTDRGTTWSAAVGFDSTRDVRIAWASGLLAFAVNESAGVLSMTEDGGASWRSITVFQGLTRVVAGNGTIAVSLSAGAQMALDGVVSGERTMVPAALPGALVAGGGRVGGIALGRGATTTSGTVYAVVVPASAPASLIGCRGALWRSNGGLAGPWVELSWTALCDLRVDPFDATPEEVLGLVFAGFTP